MNKLRSALVKCRRPSRKTRACCRSQRTQKELRGFVSRAPYFLGISAAKRLLKEHRCSALPGTEIGRIGILNRPEQIACALAALCRRKL